MIFAPKPLGNLRLNPEDLREDKKQCKKIGPCGIGTKAIYLNSFFIDRTYYVTWTDVRRCFKRVAMSRGGYTGKGIFGSMPYLVVQLSNGLEKQCNFKQEEEVDRFLQEVEKVHPEIPTHSREAEKRLAKAAAQEEARYRKTLSAPAAAAVEELQRAKSYLEERPEVGEALSRAARQKRSVDGIRKSNFAAALMIFLLGVAGIVAGVASLFAGNRSWAIYCILFGVAAVFFTGAAGILPTTRKNKRTVQRDWEEALRQADEYIRHYDGKGTSSAAKPAEGTPSVFPVPAQYAHSIVLERMIRIIREGKAEDIPTAFEWMKRELRELDHTKTVSQKEYDEIVTIKPMFRVMNYQ